MPIADDPKTATDKHRIVRVLRGVRGEMKFTFQCAPRFDYARARHTVEITDHGAVLAGPNMRLTLHGASGLRQQHDVVLTRVVCPNDFVGVILESGTDTPPRPVTSLPEQPGGERNWDYRFTWVRDASFSVGALLAIGFTDEALAFLGWLRDRVEEHVGTSSGPLKIMYRVDGSSELTEESLNHLAGYRNSRPVRVGNGAADQLQLDIYGEAMFALRQVGSKHAVVGNAGWKAIRCITDWLVANWDQPDEGIWETRGGRRNFTYRRVMSWVALDGAIRLARDLGRPADLTRWTAARDAMYEQILERGWSAQRLSFVQYPGSDVLDASTLVMPITGFVMPRDPTWLSTLDAIEHDLVSDSLVYRYNPSASPDGLTGNEGTFSICSFWYVDALARSGATNPAHYRVISPGSFESGDGADLDSCQSERAQRGRRTGWLPAATQSRLYSGLGRAGSPTGVNTSTDGGAT
jgi:glycosyl hydrolase family 15